MGSIVFRITALMLLSFFFGACSILQRGYTDNNGQYVPKNPNFKLKDKQGIYPAGLDTVNIYKMVKMYNNGCLVYPLPNSNNQLNSILNYIKFYSNGRCLIFSIPAKDDMGFPSSLKEEDLNPNNRHSSKNYYYSPNGKNIQIENFVYGDGQGYYVTSDYILSDSGNTLTRQEKYFQIVYMKETIPTVWNKYKIDW